ncbi:MAG: class E sortase [Candidatus Saccharibacteria bacterium]
MKPEESSNSQGGMSLSQQGQVPSTPQNDSQHHSQKAAAQIIRSQINNLFEKQNNITSSETNTNTLTGFEDTNPYERDHSEHPTPQVNEWKQYHTAWQNYYQKYYESYYKQNTEKSKSNHGTKSSSRPRTIPRNSHNYFANNSDVKSIKEPEDILLGDEVVFDLRQKLINKVNNSALKIKKSRHFIPLIAGLIVMIVFLFLQYNRVVVSNVLAYVSPGSIDQQNIIIDPNSDLVVGPQPKLIIPKINVDVPVTYDIGNDYSSQMTAMGKGVAHFAIPGADSHPGQVGNTVIAGHSSNDLLEFGDYKFIFAQLDKLEIGDTIYANYESKRYTYTVTKKEIVKPNNVSSLVYATSKPILTLVTCTPLGTSLNRLLIIAEQISPDPSLSTVAPNTPNVIETKSIPGSAPTLLESIFGSSN